jgi:lactaldehyde dehydrogenase/glycolaldehyde dehydrogenase
MLIDGKWVQSEDQSTFNVINPATEQIVAQVPSATVNDTKEALESAESAQPDWESLSPLQRSKYLCKTAELIMENQDRLARILTEEQGKPIFESMGEVAWAAENFRYYGEFARRIEGDVLPGDNSKQVVLILRLPLGVVVGITPWNFPSGMVARKVGPALITGNTLVLKPSSVTPLSAIELVKLMVQAGVPRGVVNLVTGRGEKVGAELVRNPITKLVTMTGSTTAGQEIMRSASNNLAKLVLELGGKAPFLVWNDCDLDWAVKNAVWGRFWNCGQVCVSTERIYIHKNIADEFVRKFTQATKSLRIGDPFDPQTNMGPRVNKQELERGDTFVKEAVKEGAKILAGGKAPPNLPKGYWYEPTILDNVSQSMKVVQEEVFGPIVPILRVENADEAIRLCNDSKYGLSSYVFTKDLKVALRAMYEIKCGETYINQIGPEAFQGVHTGFRMSGVGAEGARYGVEIYTQLKTVYLDYNPSTNVPYIYSQMKV